MFEFEHFDRSAISRLNHPPLSADALRQFGRDRIRSYSLMNWGEHCTECAFPSCYTTCSFYQPRQDGRCRRFTFGIYRAESPYSWMGYSAYVEFKHWSKLWTQGNATQLPDYLNGLLQIVGTTAWTLSKPFDWMLQRITGKKRLSLVLQSVRRRIIRQVGKMYYRFPKPDCLLIEVFNPMPTEAQLQLQVKGRGVPGRFEWTDRAKVGFSSFSIPVAALERAIDLGQPIEMTLAVWEEDGKKLYFCSATFVRFASLPIPANASTKASQTASLGIEPSAGRAPNIILAADIGGNGGAKKIKCVVWDLDHTLWDGVLVEGKPADFALKDGIRTALMELDRRGILLSIASKNAEDDARKALEELGVWKLFLASQITWQPKSVSLQQIAAKLNIGIDSLAFVDDMAFERDEVATALPMVTVVPPDQLMSLLGQPEFAGDVSGEGASRRLMYQTELEREQARAAAGLDYDAFLAGCRIRISIKRPGEELLPRVYDIVQRTNQLNIATQRYQMDELRALIHDPDRFCYIVSCTDKYGDYGHVGFVVIVKSGSGILLRDCMFSCRVQGKRIDEAALAHLLNYHLRDTVTAVEARFKPTKRNVPAGEMLARVGFTVKTGAEGTMAITPLAPRAEVPFVSIESDLVGKLTA